MSGKDNNDNCGELKRAFLLIRFSSLLLLLPLDLMLKNDKEMVKRESSVYINVFHSLEPLDL